MTDQDKNKKGFIEVLQGLAITQIGKAFVDSFRLPTWSRPQKNTFARFLCATVGAFFPFFFAIPIFLYLAVPSVFVAFVDWLKTIALSAHIGIVILVIYFSVALTISSIFGLIVSYSVSDDNTLAEMTQHGFKFTFNIALRFCLVLALFMLFRYIFAKWSI